MTGLLPFLLLVAGGALWLLVRPALRRAFSGLDPKLAGGGGAALLFVAALVLFAIRLAPLGVVFLIMAAGTLGSAMRRPDPALADDEDGQAGKGAGPARRQTGMSRKEALEVLGLSAGTERGEIEAAYRKMIRHAHPDGGGSDYLAAKVNQARDVLLR